MIASSQSRAAAASFQQAAVRCTGRHRGRAELIILRHGNRTAGGALRLLTCQRMPGCLLRPRHQHMAQIEGDFEKGEAGGALDALNLISAAAGAWIQSGQS